jgi:hypothetical protein
MMVSEAQLADRIGWGMNIAARRLGSPADAYRPQGTEDPVQLANRFIRLYACFTTPQAPFRQSSDYGTALWHGIFDSSYTRVGDYIVQGSKVWFVAGQEPLLPVLCVRTNRTLSFSRPGAPRNPGANGYAGVTASSSTLLLRGWPASVLGTSGGGRPDAGLPTDGSVAYWTVLLPAAAGVVLRASDLMVDDLGRNGVIAAAELTELGWRLTVKQAAN